MASIGSQNGDWCHDKNTKTKLKPNYRAHAAAAAALGRDRGLDKRAEGEGEISSSGNCRHRPHLKSDLIPVVWNHENCRGKSKQTVHQKLRQLSNKIK